MNSNLYNKNFSCLILLFMQYSQSYKFPRNDLQSSYPEVFSHAKVTKRDIIILFCYSFEALYMAYLYKLKI